MIATSVMTGCGGQQPEPKGTRSGRVVRVRDGDTIVVAGVGTVHYLGNDTPE
jgi:endonuclease YncB( thermonuclease family)